MSFPTTTILPATTNSLNAQQRSRLIRSTRKLGAVLGTTPLLVDTTITITTTTTTPKSNGSRSKSHATLKLLPTNTLTSSSTNASTASLPSLPSSDQTVSTAFSQQPLMLQLRPARNRAGTGASIDSLADLLSPSLSLPTTPTTPSFSNPALELDLDARRKKIAKLARTLGETIPPELVFKSSAGIRPVAVAPAAEKPAPAKLSRHKSARSLAPTRPASSPVFTSFDDSGMPESPTTPTNAHRRGITHDFGNQRGSFFNGKRKGKEWSGEWNVPDMDAVVKNLRGLKAA